MPGKKNSKASSPASRNRRKTKRVPDDSSPITNFLASLEERLTGRIPPVPAQDHKEVEERFMEFANQQRLAWIRRPRIHTAIFETVVRDEEFAKQGWSVPQAAARIQEVASLAKDVGWSDARLLEFTKLVVRYREEQRIEDYLAIKQAFPEVEIQISQFGGISPLFALQRDFEEQGIDPDLVTAALDSDEPSIDTLSVRLLELLVARERLPKSGPKFIERRRSAISDTMVNFLIMTMLEGFDWHEDVGRIPASLIVLIRHQLVGSSPDLHKAALARQKRQNAAFLAAQRLKRNERVSVRRLTALMGVPKSTAARWLADEEFVKSFESNRRMVESPGFAEMLQRLQREQS